MNQWITAQKQETRNWRSVKKKDSLPAPWMVFMSIHNCKSKLILSFTPPHPHPNTYFVFTLCSLFVEDRMGAANSTASAPAAAATTNAAPPSDYTMHQQNATSQQPPSECPMHQTAAPKPNSECPMRQGQAADQAFNTDNMVSVFSSSSGQLSFIDNIQSNPYNDIINIYI